MTLGTLKRNVRSGQRESGQGVIEVRRRPGAAGVALLALLGKTADCVVRLGRVVELLLVTALALARVSGELA